MMRGTWGGSINGTTPAILFSTANTAMAFGRDIAGTLFPSRFYIDRVKIFNVVHPASTRCTFVIGGTVNAASGNCNLPP